MGIHVVEKAAELGSLPATKKYKQHVSSRNTVPESWVTARSLRPDTQQLAEDCIGGDEEAIAIRDAYQFHTDRATRVILVSSDDPLWDRHNTFVSEGGNVGPRKAEMASPPVQSEAAIKDNLNAAYSAYKGGGKAERFTLWECINTFALRRIQSYKYQSLRWAGTDADFVNEFNIHAMRKVDEDKFHGQAAFGNWIETVFGNFAKDALNAFSKEKLIEVGFASLDDDDEDQETSSGLPHRYVAPVILTSSSQVSIQREQTRVAARMEENLMTLDQADRAYASLIAQGYKQKEAAAAMGESVVTSRKRQKRIQSVLVDLDACADDSNVICISAAADDGFEPLLSAAEAALLLGVHEKTVQAMAREGTIPCTRLGKYWRFRASVLDTWVNQQIESSQRSRRVA